MTDDRARQPSAATVLLHGFTGAPASWDTVRSQLRVPVRCEPIAGHASDVRDVPARFVDEVDRIAARIPQGASLCGYSLGARIALGIAIRHPRAIRKLVLVGVHPGLASDVERSERLASDERWARLLDDHGVIRFADAWEDQPMLARDPATQAIRRAHDPHALAAALRGLGLGAMPDWTPHLGELRMPVTLVVGELDAKFRALAERFPHAHTVVVPGARHDILHDAPAAVAAAIEEQP